MIIDREYLKVYFGRVKDYGFRDIYANLESIYYDLLRKLPDGFYDKEAVFPPGIYLTFWLDNGVTLKIVLDNTSEIVGEISENAEWEILYSIGRSSGLPVVQPPFDLRIDVFKNNQKIETLFLRVREYALSVLATAAAFEDVKNNILKQLISTYKGSVDESIILKYFVSRNYKNIGLFYDSSEEEADNIEKIKQKIRLNEYFGDSFTGLRGILSDVLFPTIDRITRTESDIQKVFSDRINSALLASKTLLSSSFYRRSILGIDFYINALKFVFGCPNGLLEDIKYALCDSAIIPSVTSLNFIKEEGNERCLVFPNSYRFLMDSPLDVYKDIYRTVFREETLRIGLAQLGSKPSGLMYFGVRKNPGEYVVEGMNEYIGNPLYANNIIVEGGEVLETITEVPDVFPNLNSSNQIQWDIYDVLVPMNLYKVDSKPSLYSDKAITLSGSMSVSMQSDAIHEIYSGGYSGPGDYVKQKINKLLTSFVSKVPAGFLRRDDNNNIVFQSTGRVGSFILQSPLVFRPYYLFVSIVINKQNLKLWKELMDSQSVDNRVVMQRVMLQVVSTLWSFYKIIDFVYPILMWVKFVGDDETTQFIRDAIEGFTATIRIDGEEKTVLYSSIVPNRRWEGFFGYFTLAEFSESFQTALQAISDSGVFLRRPLEDEVLPREPEEPPHEPSIYGVPSIFPYTTLHTSEGYIPINLPVAMSENAIIAGNSIYSSVYSHIYKLEVLPTGQTVLRWVVPITEYYGDSAQCWGLYLCNYVIGFVAREVGQSVVQTVLLIDKGTGNIVATYDIYDDVGFFSGLVGVIADTYAVLSYDFGNGHYNQILNLATSEIIELDNDFRIYSCVDIGNSKALALASSGLMLFNTSGEILRTENYPENHGPVGFVPSAEAGTVGMVLEDWNTNTYIISKVSVLPDNSFRITPIISVPSSAGGFVNAIIVGDKVHWFGHTQGGWGGGW